MKTLAKPGQAKLVERRSRFLAFAYPVSSEHEIEAHLAAAYDGEAVLELSLPRAVAGELAKLLALWGRVEAG